ncbi:hypothetical protein SOMG_02333 [Schizosaccharomyces osmophilus]|uniref:Uncharacterized protein n=1 Tax=Schizosaccharomyces osmophilus TaxID=2545709 RepID=A0AAF0ASL4_9SCHI|nr:uncharacterized protein SOMG_02333 [Schizosaccharomyces osmophilus]WBW71011.1 hypothetical protein SOMG_02333 [Schizosaccharomyces osmophilus]
MGNSYYKYLFRFFICCSLLSFIKADSDSFLSSSDDNNNDFDKFQFRLACQRVNADDQHPKYNSIDDEGNSGIGSTYFNLQDWELALGYDEKLLHHISQLSQTTEEINGFSVSRYIRPEERDTFLGPFTYNGSSVRTLNFPANSSKRHEFLEIEEKTRGVYCFATRPLLKNGSVNMPYTEFNRMNPEFEGVPVPHERTVNYFLLMFPVSLLFLATCWVCMMLLHRSKLLPVHYGLLLLIICSVLGKPSIHFIIDLNNYTFFGPDQWIKYTMLTEIKRAIDIFAQRLVLFLIAFGYGVWRPIDRKSISCGILVLSIPMMFCTINQLTTHHYPWLVAINQFLGKPSHNLVWMYATYLLNHSLKSAGSVESAYSMKLAKQSLWYCVARIALDPIVLVYFQWGDFYAYYTILYGFKVLLPCYIWRVSKNELTYNSENEKEYEDTLTTVQNRT